MKMGKRFSASGGFAFDTPADPRYTGSRCAVTMVRPFSKSWISP